MILKNKLLLLSFVVLVGCDTRDTKTYEVVNKDLDGRLSVINQDAGEMLIINKSNRIEDVISLKLSLDQIDVIKKGKAAQDLALKVREWPKNRISNTLYSVGLSTRYYKDRLLYKISFSPADKSSIQKAKTLKVYLRDNNGFVLEEIDPNSQWGTVVNESGKSVSEIAEGEIPMTLDNYLQVSGFDSSWRF